MIRLFPLLTLFLLLSGCATVRPERPDLARLYERHSADLNQPPVILIHGLMGSTLVDSKTGKQFWPGSLGTLAFSTYSNLARMTAESADGPHLVPGDLFTGIGGVDYYGALIDTLEHAARYTRGVPGQPVGGDRRRYYVLVYDWRKDNIEAVRKLHALIDQIRLDYADPNLRVDIIAHSNGGLIADYYLRYGPTDVLDQPEPQAWDQGGKRVRRMVLLGTPLLGAVTSLERLMVGFRLTVRVIPVEVLAMFATPFEALPHPLYDAVLDPAGRPVAIDLYDAQVWRDHHWSVFSPEVAERVQASAKTPADAAGALAELQATFARNLDRAKGFHRVLSPPFRSDEVSIAMFGGDCALTEAHAVLEPGADGVHMAFRPGDVQNKQPGVDYDKLMLEPGDRLVTRSSQLARESGDPAVPGRAFNFFPQAQNFFLCESHEKLTTNVYFQDNLLYFLLGR
jgi:pimeloyl-ACP methyl ester carboxylesterase